MFGLLSLMICSYLRTLPPYKIDLTMACETISKGYEVLETYVDNILLISSNEAIISATKAYL